MTHDSTHKRRGLFGEEFLPFSSGIQRVVDTIFPDLVNRSGSHRRHRMFVPHVDVEDTEQDVVIYAELPGMSEEDIDVTFEGDTLVLRGEKRQETREEREDSGRGIHERSYGSFERRITIPAEVNEDMIEATFDRGVLEIRLPKTERAKVQARKIKINPAAGRGGAGHRPTTASVRVTQPQTSSEGRGTDGGRSPGINES